jgi:hypothetical protein
MRASGCFLRFGILALAVHLLAASGLAQETDAQSPATPDGAANSKTDGNSYSLSGTVINAITGEPVRRAAVQISGQSGRVTLTDAGGHFAVQGLAEGNVFLRAMKPGFYDDEGSHLSSARVGKDAPAVVLKLTPWAVISGRVTTKDNQPLEGFQIHILAKQNVAGRLIWIDRPNQARTNEDGEFRVTGLQAGTYYVAVDQSTETTLGQRGVPNAREQTFAKVFYPGVPNQTSAASIEITPGGEAEADFTLSPEPLYQVSGSLSGSSNMVAGLTFARKAGDDADFTQMTGDLQDGNFQVKLPAGAYSVSGQTREGVELTTPGATVVIRSDEADLRIPLHAATTIPVEIQKEQGAGGSERKAPIQGIIPGLILQLVPLSQSRRGNNFWTGQPGGIPNVAPGTYRLEINTNGEWWVKSAQCGGVDLLSDDLTLTEGEQLEAIEVVLRDGAGMVTGTVTSAGDPGPVLVLLVQPHGTRNIIHAARAMQGSFAIPGIPPGDYAIVAFDGGDGLEYADPEILNPYLSDAEHVTVRSHATVTVNLGLTSVKR